MVVVGEVVDIQDDKIDPNCAISSFCSIKERGINFCPVGNKGGRTT